jgi:tRNA 5-methylaminomethyl-2-thiouridine biosynthesis bifunctional protein
MTMRQAVVIGAGLAGAAVARALALRGWQVQLLDAADGPARRASALPVGMLSPLQTRSPTPMSRLTEAGVARMRSWLADGLPQGAGWQDTEVDNLGHAPGRWPAAMIRPAALVQAWLAEARETGRCETHWCRTAHRLVPATDGWQVLDEAGEELARAAHVVIAAAWGGDALLRRSGLGFDAQTLPLRPVKGQLSYGPWDGPPLAERPRRDHGVYVPLYVDRAAPPGTPHRIWAMGSTYERGRSDTTVERAAHERNLQSLQALCSAAASHMARAMADGSLLGWSDVRCASLDRVPLLGTLPDLPALRRQLDQAGHRRGRVPLEHSPRLRGLHTFVALGSRGLSLALAGGEWLAQHLGDGTMLLPSDLVQAVDPARFAWRLWRRQPQAAA